MNKKDYREFHIRISNPIWRKASIAKSDQGFTSWRSYFTHLLANDVALHKESLTNAEKERIYGDQ